jgi:hypothetical protein
VLAIMRLFGGVPWDYVLAGGCITLTATLLAGALSLWLSTYYRYGSKAVSAGLLMGIIFFVVPELVLPLLGSYRILNVRAILPILTVTNPFHALYVATAELWAPGISPARAYAPWMLNSLIMLGLALLLLTLTIRRVRKAAVQGMSSEGRPGRGAAGRAIKRLLGNTGAAAGAAGPVRHVQGSPVVWKETRRGLLYGWSLSDIVICVFALIMGIAPGVILGDAKSDAAVGIGLFVAWLLSILILVRLVVECAGNVPREREARTWPILLTTLLEDREIVNGKAKAALLRNAPLLITLAAMYLLFLVLFPRAETLFVAAMALVSQVVSILLVVGIGSYFGVTLKTRTSAIVATIVVCLAMKYVIGGMFMFFAMPLLARAGGHAGGLGFLLVMLIPAVIQVTIAVAAIRVAVQRVRHDVF